MVVSLAVLCSPASARKPPLVQLCFPLNRLLSTQDSQYGTPSERTPAGPSFSPRVQLEDVLGLMKSVLAPAARPLLSPSRSLRLPPFLLNSIPATFCDLHDPLDRHRTVCSISRTCEHAGSAS